MKPCFVEKRTGTPASAAGELPVGVGVDEMRVQDPRPSAREVAGEPQERDGSTSARSGIASSGTPRRLELAGEVPGARLVLVQHQHPDVPAALRSRGSSESRCASEPEMPGDLLQVEDGPT